MRLRSILGLVVCGALLGQPGVPQAHHHDEGQRIEFGELRDHPVQYMGQTVTFDANVDGIVGTNVVRIGSPGAFDWFSGSLLAYAPDAKGIAVRDDEHVTITGTLEAYDRSRLEPYLSWIDPARDLDEQAKDRPVVRITHIYNTEDNRDAFIRDAEDVVAAAPDAAVGDAGQAPAGQAPVGTTGVTDVTITDVDEVFDAGRSDVGRKVQLQVEVSQLMGTQAFMAGREDDHLLVRLPDDVVISTLQPTQVINIEGVLMQMPSDMRFIPGLTDEAVDIVEDTDVYILATDVETQASDAEADSD